MEALLGEFGPVSPILGMEHPWHYRNKAISTFCTGPGRRLDSGIYAAGTHRVVPVDSCLLHHPALDEAVEAVRRAARLCRYEPYQEDRGTGLVRHVLVRHSRATGRVLVALVTAAPVLPGARAFVSKVRELCPRVETPPLQRGAGAAGEGALGQGVHRGHPVRGAVPAGGLQLLSDQSGADGGPLPHRPGRGGAGRRPDRGGRLLRRGHHRPGGGGPGQAGAGGGVQPLCADATAYLQGMAARGERADVVFLDPPRAGSTPEFLGAVDRMGPERIVYISCNPETQRRDLRRLAGWGWRARLLQPVDLFPHTEHVECVAVLAKIRGGGM